MDNPKAALNALIAPGSITIARMALLDRISSPLLRFDTTSWAEDARAIYLCHAPLAEAQAAIDNHLDDKALALVDKMSVPDYCDAVRAIVNGISAIWGMLPAAEAGKPGAEKKTSATAGSPS